MASLAASALILAAPACHVQAADGGGGTGKAAGDVFTVRDVDVDVTADNAAAARDQAIEEGEAKAFDRLVTRLTQPSPGRQPPHPSAAELTELVQNFEVQREKTSAVRYLGTLTFRFRPQVVRRVLGNSGVSFTEIRSKPVLVLPVERTAGKPVLWDDRTPWRAAWENASVSGGLVPIVVPAGELTDIADIGADEALGDAPGPFEKIGARYDAGEVTTAIIDTSASPPSPDVPLQVTLLRHPQDGPPRTETVTVPASAGGSPDALLTGAVAATVAYLEDTWKRDTATSGGAEGDLLVEAPYTGMKEWIEVRRRLSSVPTISKFDIVSLSRSAADLRLHFRGNPERLQTAMAQRNLSLTALSPQTPPDAAAQPASGPAAAQWQLRLATDVGTAAPAEPATGTP